MDTMEALDSGSSATPAVVVFFVGSSFVFDVGTLVFVVEGFSEFVGLGFSLKNYFALALRDEKIYIFPLYHIFHFVSNYDRFCQYVYTYIFPNVAFSIFTII